MVDGSRRDSEMTEGYDRLGHIGVYRRLLSMTLPRLGSWVRIPSPAPITAPTSGTWRGAARWRLAYFGVGYHMATTGKGI